MTNMESPPVKRLAIDIRVFLATITTAMALAFGVGVGMGPAGPTTRVEPAEYRQMQDRVVRSVETLAAASKLQNASDEVHQAAGQHLLVDIKGVDSDFLDSEERLSKAMVDAVIAGGLTMLSYHCHKLHPSGVSCVGVLLESHISFHTWPGDGVITLDLFTCGSNSLMPVIPKLKELFGVGENSEMQWSHELRGFRHEKDSRTSLDTENDLSFWVLSPLELHTKKEVVTVKSKFQQIDIWDILDVDSVPSHYDAIKHNLQPGDPRWLTPELATPDRLLFLDGILQVSLLICIYRFG
jgi:S-adenosylmethionine decarboxylase proenzyme